MKLWEPPEKDSQLKAFLKTLESDFGKTFSGYPELHKWSVEAPDNFWSAVWRFAEIQSSFSNAFTAGEDIRSATWFRGAKLNFAENLLRYQDARTAIVFKSELGETCEISYSELAQKVALLAKFLRDLGVKKGDRVAAVLPNLPETIIATLATASLGAIWSSCSPDFGAPTILDRFKQIAPKVIFFTSGYTYGGKSFNCAKKNKAIIEGLKDSLEHSVLVPFSEEHANYADSNLIDILSTGETPELTFEALPFEHPLYILFSSGTTGVPKCIVHSAGGTLLQHRKEHLLHCNLTRSDKLFYFTTCGWMMWNWLISGLASGSTLVLFEGSPTHPGPEALFDLVDEAGITIFGTSAKYLSAIEKMGLKPKGSHKLTSLKAILSTGSPLLPESFDYVYRDIKEDLCLSSISGGTDIVSCFVLGNPDLPVYRGEIQCLGLGMDVKVYSEGKEAPVGTAGELVCASPFPSMPVGFWNDEDGSRYQNSYFSKYPGVWCHGDWCELTDNGGMIIYGRSDTTLNPGGVRIGTAEIYRAVDSMDEIVESLAVGQDWQGDERILLFVVTHNGIDSELETKIKAKLKTSCSPRHVPAKIFDVQELPRTRSGKITELAVKNIFAGRGVENKGAIANPEALERFEQIAKGEGI